MNPNSFSFHFFKNRVHVTVINLNILIWFLVSEVIYAITSIVRDACGKAPSERLFLDKYGKICLCLDEIVWKVSFVKKNM